MGYFYPGRWIISSGLTGLVRRSLHLETDSYGADAKNKLHPVLFDKIVWPVFAREYENNNAKYIRMIGQCRELIESNKFYLTRIDAFEILQADSVAFLEYFWGKSFSLDKNQNTLDSLMRFIKLDVFLLWRDLAWFKHIPDSYFEILKHSAGRLERCKEYCKQSNSNKWDKLLNVWDTDNVCV